MAQSLSMIRRSDIFRSSRVVALRFVAIGGTAGALTRWAILDFTASSASAGPGERVQWVMVGINLFGSFLMGIFFGGRTARRGRHRHHPTVWLSENQWVMVGPGFCGGLTSFSTFAIDVATALDDGAFLDGLAVTAATALGAVLFGGIGYRFGSRR